MAVVVDVSVVVVADVAVAVQDVDAVHVMGVVDVVG